mmetsp:Transcript_7647/g.32266  ORF Transcript_7647/g.32266 Transcript_7647/m.32266 type:complete len:225 (-) Transcript_7647:905-1579(-)
MRRSASLCTAAASSPESPTSFLSRAVSASSVAADSSRSSMAATSSLLSSISFLSSAIALLLFSSSSLAAATEVERDDSSERSLPALLSRSCISALAAALTASTAAHACCSICFASLSKAFLSSCENGPTANVSLQPCCCANLTMAWSQERLVCTRPSTRASSAPSAMVSSVTCCSRAFCCAAAVSRLSLTAESWRWAALRSASNELRSAMSSSRDSVSLESMCS